MVSQGRYKSMKAWRAYFRILKHQPPSRRITRIDVGQRGVHPESLTMAKSSAIFRKVLPTLVTGADFPGIKRLIFGNVFSEPDLVWALSILSESHITEVETFEGDGTQGFTGALVHVIESHTSLQTLELSGMDWGSVRLAVRAINANATVPTASQLRTLIFSVETSHGNTSFAHMPCHIVQALVGPSATHSLESITIDFCDPDPCFVPEMLCDDVRSSLWRLALIPTLRSLCLRGGASIALYPNHVAVLKDCVRTRARSGAPPLEKIVVAHGVYDFEREEELDHFALDEIEYFLAIESPSTIFLRPE